MKTFILGLTAIAAILPAAAQARPWQGIDARQDRLYSRIEQGVRSGALTRREATGLRRQFVQLERVERNYRRSGGGLDIRERADLNRRFDALSARVRYQKADRDHRRHYG